MSYAELHCHDCYSLLDAISKPEEIISKAKEYGYSAIAITNHGNMFSMVNFQKEGEKQGVKTILGIEAYEADNLRIKDDTRYHLILLAKNNEGLKALYELSSISYLEGFYKKPRLDIKEIEPYAKDLIISSACMAGRIDRLLLADKYNEAKEWIYKYKKVFPNFYLEMQHHDVIEQANLNKLIVRLGKETGTPYIMTSDSHYINKEDQKAHSIFIQTNEKREVGEIYDGCYLKSEKEIKEIMMKQIDKDDIELAISNTEKIAKECNVKIDLSLPNQMPEIPIPKEFKNINQYYMYLINKGFKEKKLNKLPKNELKKHIERIKSEYEVLDYVHYIDYFVMLYMLTKAAKKRNIPLGFSRGSGGNCLTLFDMGVTGINSLRYNLDFSRFASKGRTSLADYDMDMSKRRRKEIIDISKELFNKYEDILHTQVAPICTFNSFSTKVACRDIGKALQVNNTYPDLTYQVRDIVAKMIPKVTRYDEETGEAIEEDQQLKSIIDSNEKLQTYAKKYPLWFKYIIKLEGLPKSLGCHASGVVISPKPIIDYAPLCLNKDKQPMIQLEMHNVLDDLHLVKMDFLGLKTLDVIDDALKLAKLTYDDIDINKINLNDPKVYKNIYKKGNTIGVFQMESAEARQMNIDAQTDNIEDVIALNALNRPACKAMFPDFVENKQHPENMKLIHEDLRSILQSTYGVLLYQEQSLSIFRLANFPDSEVDLARRAIGKKDMEIMKSLEEKLRDKVVKDEDGHILWHYGLKQRGWADKQIEDIWKLLLKQATYSFNKGHSTAYGLLSYITAWLKTYYPTEFMTALLNSEIGDYEKIAKYIIECKKMNVKVIEPDINKSIDFFSISKSSILFGINMIKNVGDSVIPDIINNRPYQSFNDFITRCNIGKRATIALIKSGAFNEFNKDKSTLLYEYCKSAYTPTVYKPVKNLKTKKTNV
ncbi:DNA polymerase III subunit alpha [Clostridium acetobutylicum]|uniref:DNA polymerase III subunit alpha n=1 Tax=Clostridium acetobutylicum TaxID=1488 RepID=UPI0017AED9B3|nr:DNA polymerase III subunit alpha [Clostridium acetobutylicum]NYC94983.1 DNA polymerase-3 subunit alpha [Clostridium acetobutylicum]